jgi:hypothetical protein
MTPKEPTMSKRTLYATLALAMIATDARAQDRPAAKPPTPLKLDVVFMKFEGQKKVSSVPYTLSLNADGRQSAVRMGIQVPLATTMKDAPGGVAVVYKDVGNNVDCSAQPLEDGRFAVECSLQQSSLYSMEGAQRSAWLSGSANVTAPLIRTFSAHARLLLRHGETAPYTIAADPVSGELLKVDITLSVIK